MNPTLSRTKRIAYSAMLIAFSVIVGRLLGLAQPGPIFAFNRLGVGISITMFASLFLGPFFGALVGVAGDALGWVILGQWTGAFNIYLSVFYALVGVLPWLMAKGLGRWMRTRYSIIAFCITFVLCFVAFSLVLWLTPVFEVGFTRWNLDPLACRIFITALFAPLVVATVVLIVLLQWKGRDGVNMGEIAWMSFAVEIVTIFLKPLAFYLYCLTFLGTNIETAWNISYSTLVLLSLVFSFADIIVNIGFLRLLLWVKGKTLVHEKRKAE